MNISLVITTRDNRQVSVGAMGGLVVHPYGVSATQPLGETMALVKAENAADVKVANNSGIYTDSKGFAVVPYVAPYRQNSLTLNTDTLNNNTDVLSDTQTVVPTKERWRWPISRPLPATESCCN